MARDRNPVVIVHGWSDTSASFQSIAGFLRSQGFQTVALVLADYVSMDDDVSIDDAAQGMERAMRALLESGTLTAPFDLIVHSTGALVSRAWLTSYHMGKPEAELPVQRLVMLAPANFGSALATMGQTIIGRVVKGWNHSLHTGKQMLQGLELGSPFQWELAMRDLFRVGPGNHEHTIYGADQVWPFVLTGTMPYQHGLRQLVNESGSDGTVRVAAANLNAYGATLDFTVPDVPEVMGMTPDQDSAQKAMKQCAFIPWRPRHDENMAFPLAVMPHRDHASITDPMAKGDGESDEDQQRFHQFLRQALDCQTYEEYQQIERAWRAHSDEVQSERTADDDRQMHVQINVFVVDEYQRPVTDYMIEFLAPNYAQNTDLTGMFHDKVIRRVSKNQQNGALRTIYINRQRLFELFYASIPADQPKELRLSISASAPGANVQYFGEAYGARGEFILHSAEQAQRWLRRNSTHFLKIVVPRQPLESVFRLTKFG